MVSWPSREAISTARWPSQRHQTSPTSFDTSTGIPQCTVGHPARMARVEAGLGRWPGLHVTGWGYRGVSINHCIAEAAVRTIEGRQPQIA